MRVLPLEPGGTGSKLSYRPHHAQRSGERDQAGSSHTCLRLIAAGRKLGSFSGSIPPSFVLSYNMPMINTTSNWLCSGAFRSPPALCFRFTGHSSLATGHWPPAPRSSGSAVDAARRAEYSTPHLEGPTCYDMLRFPLPAEVWRARFSSQVNIES